jgi:hypothetical protein
MTLDQLNEVAKDYASHHRSDLSLVEIVVSGAPKTYRGKCRTIPNSGMLVLEQEDGSWPVYIALEMVASIRPIQRGSS